MLENENVGEVSLIDSRVHDARMPVILRRSPLLANIYSNNCFLNRNIATFWDYDAKPLHEDIMLLFGTPFNGEHLLY